jgi:hypothetical protein
MSETTCTVCEFCEVESRFPRSTDFMSFSEVEQIYRRWASLARDSVYEALLLRGWLSEQDSSEQFDKFWNIIWGSIGDLGLSSTTYESFVAEFSQVVEDLYQTTWRLARAAQARIAATSDVEAAN